MDKSQIKKDLCEFLQWIKKPSPYYMIVKLSNTEYRLVTDYATGEVNVYPQDMIELRITASKTNKTCFFLHFAFGDLNRAKQLFLEMTDVLKQMVVQRDIRVLLTCSSALTTSYFAERLNNAAASMNKKMHFDAIDISRLYKRGFNYDIVLLAPQVGYMYENASAILKNVKVCHIPGDIYGTYDVSALINYVEKKLKGRRTHGEAEGIYIRQLRSRYRILSIPVVMDGVTVHIGSMILDHETVVYKGEAIKKTVSCDDIEDVIWDA